jgi:SPP1 family predicted phage head-tail adaptor
MAISIGKMRKRVAIYTRTDSEAGEYSSEILRAIVSTVWANVVNVTGTAQVDSRNAGTGISHRITMRFRSDISKTNEILYDGWIYRIETMQELDDDAGRFMVLECNQIAKADELADYSPEAPPPPFLYVSGTNSDFDGTYEYDRDLTQWLKGETHLIEKSGGQWVLTDGETTFVATDEGGNVPPIEFVRGVFPLRTVTSTVTGTNTDFDGAYAYDGAAARWEKGETHWIEKTGGQWEMSDGTTTYTAPDNGLNVPPSEFTGEGVPQSITVFCSADPASSGNYVYNGMYDGRTTYEKDDTPFVEIYWDPTKWAFIGVNATFFNATDSFLPPKTGWYIPPFGEIDQGLYLEYDLPTITAAVSSATSVAPTADISQTAPEEPEGE